jgi:acyl-CoA synthetase (AMP-forming)/AMP-acid ligase II
MAPKKTSQHGGEIKVRGYALTPGLHKLERYDYFTPDGFYRTGDMGVTDGAPILFLGRDGDMIKTANSNVSPAEVELEMQQLEGMHFQLQSAEGVRRAEPRRDPRPAQQQGGPARN